MRASSISSATSSERLYAAAVLLVLALVLNLGLTPYGVATSPDSLRYLDVAQNIDGGHGVVSTYHYGKPDSGYHPFTTYPPLYPLVLSLVLGPGERAERSAAHLGAATLFLSAFLIFELLRRALGPRAGLLGAVVFLVSQPTLTVFTYAWSETLAIPLLFASCWCCLRSIEATERAESGSQAVHLVLLGAALVALAYTRYIGVLFSVLLPLAWLSSRSRIRWIVRHALVGLGVVALVGALYLRNQRVSGHFSGELRESSRRGFLDNLTDTLRALYLQVAPRSATIAVVVVCLAGVVTAIWWFRKDRGPAAEDPAPAYRRHLLRLCWATFAVYTGGLIWLRSLMSLDPIDTRFIAPGFCLLLVPLLVGAGRAWASAKRTPLGALRMAGFAVLVLLVAARGLGTYGQASSAWALQASPQLALSPTDPYANYNRPDRELVHRARYLLERKQYKEVRIQIENASSLCRDDYDLDRILATAFAGLGDAGRALEHTRACLALDRERALRDVPDIAAPFRDGGRRHAAGLDYFEQLAVDLPDARWIQRNIGELADLLGHARLAEAARAQAEELEQRGPRKANGMSVILVVVDTLRADHLGVYGYRRPTSPHLDAWAAAGRLFERAYATSSWTLPSFGSILTGHLPMRHRAGVITDEGGNRSWGRLHPGVRTLAETFAAQDYGTGAVVNNPYLGPAFGADRGFADYDYFAADQDQTRRADLVVDRSLSWIDSRLGRPFFLLVHLFDPHMSYDAPPPARGKFTRDIPSRFALPFDDYQGMREKRYELTSGDREFIRAAYDEEIAFVDRQLGRFREELEGRGIADRTLVILTSDHGEELFEHSGFEHGHALWEELLHVPLVIWGPGIRAGREEQPVSITDLAPTILEATGLVAAPGVEGLSLWPHLTTGEPLGDRMVFAEGNLYGSQDHVVIAWPHKLLVGPDGRIGRFVDLSVDPGELDDLAPRRPRRAIDLARELQQRLLVHRRTVAPSATAEIDPETLENLRSLGYAR